MIMRNFLFITFIGFIFGILGARLVSKYGAQFSLIDIPNERSSHVEPTPKAGGIGIWAAGVVAGSFLFQDLIFTFLMVIVGLLGLLSDMVNVPPKKRLISHVVLSAILVVYLLGVPVTVFGLVLMLLWIFFMTGTANFYNFMDGVNGIAALTGVIGFGLIAYYSYFIASSPIYSLLCLSISAACLGFLPFNFPKARVFMGDVGSLFLGFVFSMFVVKLSVSIGAFLCLLMFLCTFYADAILTIFYRYRRGDNLMQAHRSHLYQNLCNEMGLPHWAVAVIYVMIQLFFGVLALVSYNIGIAFQVAAFLLFFLCFLMLYRYVKTTTLREKEC